MREKRKYPVPIAEAFAKTRGTSAIRAKMKDWRLWDRWEELAGQAVAAHARPARWQGKILIVRVEHPSWMQELSFLKPQLTERLKREFPACGIREIRFELGELPPLPARLAKPERQSSKPLSDDDREFIDRSVERIGDDELRETARRAMTRGFERIKS